MVRLQLDERQWQKVKAALGVAQLPEAAPIARALPAARYQP